MQLLLSGSPMPISSRAESNTRPAREKQGALLSPSISRQILYDRSTDLYQKNQNQLFSSNQYLLYVNA